MKGTVDTTRLGTYTITYTCPKFAKQVTRTIKVVDHKAPKLTLVGSNPLRVFENGKLHDPGVKAMDAYDGDVSKQVKVKGTVNMSKQGSYMRTYEVQDRSGNTAKITRKIQVCKDPTMTKVYYDYAVSYTHLTLPTIA